MIQNFQELVDCFWYWTRRDGLTKLNTTIHYEKMYLMMLLNQILYNDMIIMVCSVLQIFIKMVENTSRCLFFPKLIGSSIFLILVCSIIPVTIGSPTNNTEVRFDTNDYIGFVSSQLKPPSSIGDLSSNKNIISGWGSHG